MNSNLASNDLSAAGRDDLLMKIQELEARCRQAENALRTLETQNRLLGNSAPFGIFVTDDKGQMLGANQKMTDMLALPNDQDIKQLNVLAYPPMMDSGVSEVFRQCLIDRRRASSDHSCLLNAPGCDHLRYNICPVIDKDQKFSGFITFVEDVTDLKHAEELLIASEKRYRLLFDSAPVAMVERDASALKQHLEKLREEGVGDFENYFNGHPEELLPCYRLIKTVHCNKAFLELMEVKSWDEVENTFRLTGNSDQFMRMVRDVIFMVANGNVSNEREESFLTAGGLKKSFLGKSMPLPGHEDTLSRIVVAMVDITKRKQAEEALSISEQRFRQMAMRDTLTGLFNRRYLYQSLTGLIDRAKTDPAPISVIFMDLDNFKHVVDTHGHLNGSRTIKEVGEILRQSIEGPAFAVAYAGDEFVVVLPGFDQAQAHEQAKLIQSKISDCYFLPDLGLQVRIQSSFGVATFPQHADDMTELLAAADHALFMAKGAGKNRIQTLNDPVDGQLISGMPR